MAAVKLIRALVDYYQSGVLVYKAGNTYPATDTLELLRARGDAELPKPAKASGKAATKVADESADLDAQKDGAATAADGAAPGADITPQD
jgi:hypothetical protein